MKCHYETLGIPLDADSGQIKLAYRKLALRWHPDKNPDNLEYATEQFKLVKSAYEVLSDPQDKAWYDKNRDTILHQHEFEDFDENAINLFEYFTPSCYKGFGSDSKSFFSVYGDLFTRISQQDEQFIDDDDSDYEAMPSFGKFDSDYDEVVHVFYAAWQAYSTKFSFIWADKYDVKEAPNRFVARAINKENKKVRDKKRKERNKLVYELVRFVRKRDPRVLRHIKQMEKINDEKKIKNEEKRLNKLRERVEEAAEYERKNQHLLEERDEQLHKLEAELKDVFGFSSDEQEIDDVTEENEGDIQEEEEEDEGEPLFCVACNKNFKTSMAMKNHEKSKKHREKLSLLKAEMMRENREEIERKNEQNSTRATESDDEEKKERRKKKKKKKNQKKVFNPFAAEADPEEMDEEVDDVTPDVKEETPAVSDQELEVKKSNKKKKKKRNQKKEVFGPFAAAVEAEEEDNEAEIDGEVGDATPEIQQEVPANDEEEAGIKKANKKKKRRRDKTTVAATSSTSDVTDIDNFCSTCSNKFPTRNQLFKHLKKTGHAALKR